MRWLLVLLLAACSVPVQERGDVYFVGNSEGGRIEPVQARIAHMRRTGQRVIIQADYCWSACTMYLAVAECVGADTEFGFHGAMTDYFTPSDYWTDVVAEYYPPKLRQWYLTTAASNYNPFGPSVPPVTGVEISKLTGVPICKPS